MLSIGTAVRTGRLDAPADPARLADRILRALDAALARSAPGWLGHCKLMIEAGESVCYASVTESGGPLGWSGPPPAAGPFRVTLYCAAYGVDEAQAAAAVAQALAAEPDIVLDEDDQAPR